jgi:TorA maturation chaperone TorD
MNNRFRLPPSSVILLSHLWLHEPDDDTIQRAHLELGLPLAASIDLAAAYADLFLLNVYPYGTVFTDLDGGLNGAGARRIEALYEAHNYRPIELTQVAAPDHVGVWLGFLAHAEKRLETAKRPREIGDYLVDELEWIPVCCLAVEREPTSHPFYRALASKTRETLLTQHTQSPVTNLHLPAITDPFDEIHLRDLVRFFLAPARCGMFLSRSAFGKLANSIGLRLPFDSRLDVATMLFEVAGENDRVSGLIGRLEVEVAAWTTAYQKWQAEYPAWQPFAECWLDRLDNARQRLTLMREIVENPPELEIHEIADFHGVP